MRARHWRFSNQRLDSRKFSYPAVMTLARVRARASATNQNESSALEVARARALVGAARAPTLPRARSRGSQLAVRTRERARARARAPRSHDLSRRSFDGGPSVAASLPPPPLDEEASRSHELTRARARLGDRGDDDDGSDGSEGGLLWPSLQHASALKAAAVAVTTCRTSESESARAR